MTASAWVVAAAALCLLAVPAAADINSSEVVAPAATAWWTPNASENLAFQYQLGAKFSTKKNYIKGIQVYFVDGFDTDASVVADMLSKTPKIYPVCYFSAGTWEDWRADSSRFPTAAIGQALDDWPGEKWLDIRSAEVRNIMKARIQMCKDKGFVAIDPDNVDVYTQKSGFTLTAADQIDFNKFLATTGHSLGLAVGLKNDVGQMTDLIDFFDFAVNESCMDYNECDTYAPAKAAGKPVWNMQYKSRSFKAACKCQDAFGMKTIYKALVLKSKPLTQCTAALKKGTCKPLKKSG